MINAGVNNSVKIGEVARASGVGIEALRFYERSGLLGKPGRSAGGYRLYDAGILDRLSFIKKAQKLGFSLDEIKKIITNALTGSLPCDEVREIVRIRLKEVNERVKEMQRYRRELAATLEDWDDIGRSQGHICGLIEGSEMMASLPSATGAPEKSRRKTG
jgi:DNA-binding transcriptional MerR regulator